MDIESIARDAQERLSTFRFVESDYEPGGPLDAGTMTQQVVAAYIDHTALKPDSQGARIRALCHDAMTYGFAAVCVNPTWVAYCHELLAESSVTVCTVVGFPLGATLTAVKVYETNAVIAAGAGEVDMVLNIGALRDGDHEFVLQDIRAVAEAAHAEGASLKVIFENCLLSDEQKAIAAALSVHAGADYVKTSTGFGSGGATVRDVALMRHMVGSGAGVKAAGGIQSYATLRRMVAAGATRIGASAGVAILSEVAAE